MKKYKQITLITLIEEALREHKEGKREMSRAEVELLKRELYLAKINLANH